MTTRTRDPKRWAAVFLLAGAGLMATMATATSGCGGSDGGGGGGQTIAMSELCGQVSGVLCDKVFTCEETAALRGFVGGTRESCPAVAQGLVCGMSCGAGQTYHGDKAYQCIQALKAVPCASITAGIADPYGLAPVCNEICTGGADGGAGS